ncbi:hypothetical protein [Paludibaculum fermentans]|uniref:Terminase large subunit gp17-like C-terminal domain-containing protein n=1 Tax=Paludibaculum fermentans TaxID=1473598 RepID=A0A7S7NL15_PALFE|nr:hypothetical protein [Paludibaculum fermentans]QOY85610.1 hypothetical protein IRI77_22620 [Paludibaculum fermentans]
MKRLPPHLYFGLDLGQRRDPAALAILQRIHEPTGEWNRFKMEPEWELLFRLRHVERFHLGTPYITIVDRVCELLRDGDGNLLGGWPVASGRITNPYKTLIVDASGVGAPVVELFQRANLQASLIALTITGSGAAHSNGAYEGCGYTVPRRDLVTNLRLLLERGLLRIPTRVHDFDSIREEVLNLQDGSGPRHDDMAIALALAAWWAARNVRL